MKQHPVKIIILALLFAGCTTYTTQTISPTPIDHAQQEIPEQQLLDVGITVFSSKPLSTEEAKKEGTHQGIRKAEGYYMAYHLKNTLQQSSHWGMVRVTPATSDAADLYVSGQIMESNGKKLKLKIEVNDASGKRLLKKKYKAKATEASYQDTELGKKDAFQDLYNTVANDIAELKTSLTADRIKTIRTISELKFAENMAPDTFGEYLKDSGKGEITVNRLPAKDDAMIARVIRIRERDYMFTDTLNEYYEKFYNEMWSPYDNWRRMDLTERTARAKIRREAMLKQAAGALLVATAIFLDAKNVNNTELLRGLMLVSGGAIFINGVNVSKQTKIHAAALEELSESFDDEMKPIVIQFEGKQYELTGSAEERYNRWRELLRKIYYEETGFDQPVDKESMPGKPSNLSRLEKVNAYI